MTQVPRAEVGQAEVWVTSPNDGEIRQVTVGLQWPRFTACYRPSTRSYHGDPNQGQLVVRLHAHAASLSGRWPLPDAVTWTTSWLTRSPVPGHRLAPRRAAAGPLDAGRGRISEPSLKQHG